MAEAAQYLRMSTDAQRYSLEDQSTAIGRYADAHDITIVRSYEDAGRSGLTTHRRDGLKALFSDVLSPDCPFSILLVLDVSRWGRYQDPDEGAHYEFVCRQAGVDVRYCNESFENDGTATASLVKGLKRVMAADYSRQLSERVRAGLKRQSLKGCWCGGRPAYGFRRQVFAKDGSPGPVLSNGQRAQFAGQSVRLTHGPAEEVRAIRAIFQMFADENLTMAEISRRLNRSGPAYSDGAEWTHGRVRLVLANELAIGIHVLNRWSQKLSDRGNHPPPENWVRIKVLPPIVTAARFSVAQQRLCALSGRHHSNTELLNRLRALLKIHGRLSGTIITADGSAGTSTYKRRFGSLDLAYVAVGVSAHQSRALANKARGYNRDAALGILRRLLEEKGYLSCSLIDQTALAPSSNYYIQSFGSLTETYRQIGYNLSSRERSLAAWERRKSAARQSTFPATD